MKKSFLLSFPISLVAIALSLILRSLLANSFDKIELGLYYATLDAIYFATLPFLGFRATMTVYFAKNISYENCVLRQRYAMIFMFVPLFFASIYLSNMLGVNVDIWILLLLFIATLSSIYFNNQLGMIRAYKAINIISFIEPLIPLLLFMLFVPTTQISLLSLTSVSTILIAAIALFFIIKAGYFEPKFKKIDLGDAKHFYTDSLFASLEFGFGMAILFAATFIASKNSDMLGDFQVVIKPLLMFALILFVFPILRFLAPEIAKVLGAKDFAAYNELKKFTIRYTLCAFVILFFILIFRLEIVTAIFSPKYQNAADSLIFIAFATVFAILNTFSLASLKALDGFLFSFLIRVFGFCFFICGYFFIKDNFILSLWLACTHFSMFLISGIGVNLRVNMSKLVRIQTSGKEGN